MSDFARDLAAQVPRLRRYARGLTHDRDWADDLVQDTLERALTRRGLFRGGSSLSAWLFTMLYRLFVNELKRRRPEALEEPNEPAAPGSDPGLALDLQSALARLPAEQRAVVLLVGLEQVSYKEAAAILGIPVGTVMSRLMRGRERLRSLLAGEPAGNDDSALPRLTRIK